MTGKIPKEFIQSLLLRCDIVDIIDSRVPLKRTGHNYVACCPFHQEKTPSFSVSPNKQFYHCFGCGEHGNAISFIMNYDRLNFVETIKLLADQLGMPLPLENKYPDLTKQHPDLYEVMAKACLFYQNELSQNTKAKDYLLHRGVAEKIKQTYLLGYAPDSWDGLLKFFKHKAFDIAPLEKCGLIKNNKNQHFYDVFRDRIIFPIRDKKGRVVGFGGRIIHEGEPKYLNSPETVIFHKSSEVYGLYEALQAHRHLDDALIVEGYMDVITLAQYGFTQAMACMGTAITQSHLSRILTYTQTITFCFDGDNAGKKAAWRAIENLLPLLKDGLTAKFIFLPEGQDPDTFLKTQGKESFKNLMDNATVFSQFFWDEMTKNNKALTIEEKAKLQTTVMPLLNQIQPCHVKTMMLQTLEKLTGIKERSQPSSEISKQAPQRKGISPMRTAIGLLLQYPELAYLLQDHSILQLKLAGMELLNELLKNIQTNPNCNTATLMEAYRDHAHFELLNQLAVVDFFTSDIETHQLFKDVLSKIEDSYYHTIEEKLFLKLRQGNISIKEKEIFLNLQKLKQHLLLEDDKHALLHELENLN
jgi:DNA primase